MINELLFLETNATPPISVEHNNKIKTFSQILYTAAVQSFLLDPRSVL